MAPKKTECKKPSHGLYIEAPLWEFARKKSLERGSFHKKSGSASEYIRRAFKAWLLKEMPYLKNNMNGIDFDEAY
jgi:hypothetical protein